MYTSFCRLNTRSISHFKLEDIHPNLDKWLFCRQINYGYRKQVYTIPSLTDEDLVACPVNTNGHVLLINVHFDVGECSSQVLFCCVREVSKAH